MSGIALGPRRGPSATVRGQLAAVAVLLGLTAAGWWVSDLAMSGMDAGPGTDPGTVGFYVGTWVVMMVAMMFPSITPMVLMYRGMQAGRARRGEVVPAGVSLAFVGGYLAVWAASGLLAYGLLKLGRAAVSAPLAWHQAGRLTAAAVLLSAALYELTPLKRACLRRCRGPLAFLLGSWRDGRRGALIMGLEHGAWCLGCCWALMAALFALGAMSITWMALIGALIAVEKLLPWRRVSMVSVGLVLAALALGIALAPQHVPGLTVPAHAASMSMPMTR